MKIISVWNAKGGVGKTTTATNLASGFTSRGYSVLLVDKDEQLSSYKLNQAGDFKWECVKETPAEKPDVDIVIFDHPPSQKKVPDAALVIVPFAPSKLDYDSFIDSISLLRDKNFMALVNQVDYRIKNEREFSKRVIEQGASMIKRRSVYKNAYAENKTVFEMPTTHVAKQARKEINEIIDRILSND